LLAVPECNPNIGNDKKQYPLHFAAFKKNIDCVHAMIDSNKCDYCVKDRKGRIPAEDTSDFAIRDLLLQAAKTTFNTPSSSSSIKSTTYCCSYVGLFATCALCIALYVGSSHKFEFTALHDWDTIIPTDTPAELERAWELLTAFPEYGSWNSFTTHVFTGNNKQIPVINEPVQLHVTLGPPYPFSIINPTATSNLTLNFFWTDFDRENHVLCWGIQNPGREYLDMFLTSHRCCELRFDVKMGVQVRHTDLNAGIVAPLVEYMFRDAIEHGFEQMTIDMRERLLYNA